MVTSTFAGFNMIFNSVKKALGMDINYKSILIKEIKFKRLWDGIAIYDDSIIGRV